MTKELYNELVKKGLITNTSMTFDYINEYNLTVEDIITIPAVLETLINDAVEVTNEDLTEIDDVETFDETTETVEEAPVEDAVVEEIVEVTTECDTVEEIVVEEVPTEDAVVEEVKSTKSKSKKN